MSSSANFNPCLGWMSIKTGTKVVAIFQVVVYLAIFMLSSTLAILRFVCFPVKSDYAEDAEIVEHHEEKNDPDWIMLMSIVCWSLVAFMASITLYKGARDKNRIQCKVWMIINLTMITIIIAAIGVFIIFPQVFNDGDNSIGDSTNPFFISIILGSVIVHTYFALVVFSFMRGL